MSTNSIKNQEILENLMSMNDKTSSYDLTKTVEETKERIIEQIKDSPVLEKSLICDSYGNALTGIGTEDKIKSFTTYDFNNDSLNWPLWLALYNDSWVFKRAIDKPAQDMVRSGVILNNLNADEQKEVLPEIKNQRKKLIELIQWGRLFGGSIAILMFDNLKNEDYAKPMDILKLRQAKKLSLYVVDRWYGCVPSQDTVEDMCSLDYSKPKSYKIIFSDGNSLTVHHDYVLRFEGRTAPRLIQNGALQGWGYSEGSHILNELARDDQLKASITSLVNKSLIEVIKMPGMRGLFLGADKENNNQVQQRLEMVNWARNYNSLTFLDKDDEYQEHGFGGLSGLAELLETNMWLISAALEMQGVLFGDLKTGFSNDENALERYDETINNLNENYFKSCMEKLLTVLYKWKNINEIIDFDFGSLIKKQQDKNKMESIASFQTLLSGLLSDGVITLKQYGMAIKNYAEKGIINLNISDEDIEKLDDKMEEEMENIDLENNKDEGLNDIIIK